MSSETEAEAPFEAILARLHEVASELERGDVPLERSLALFEEGVRLVRLGGGRLDHAEARVEELLATSDARGARTRPLDPTDGGARVSEPEPSSRPDPTRRDPR